MRYLRFLLGLAVATALHAVGMRLLPGYSLYVDVFLVLVVYHGLTATPAWGILGASIAGLVADALTGGPYGLYGFANTVVAYTEARLQQRLMLQQVFRLGLLFALVAAFQQAILAVLQRLVVHGAEAPGPGEMLAKMVSTGFLGMAVVMIATRVRTATRRWRLARSRRLTIEAP